MHISSQDEYGLRIALQLALNHQKSKMSASDIAQAERLSPVYTSKILHVLKKAGLVEADRGTKGGFYLVKDPSELTLKEVIEKLQSHKSMIKVDDICDKHSGLENQCIHINQCLLKPIWSLVFDKVNSVLTQFTLEDLVSDKALLSGKIKDMRATSLL